MPKCSRCKYYDKCQLYKGFLEVTQDYLNKFCEKAGENCIRKDLLDKDCTPGDFLYPDNTLRLFPIKEV